MGTTWKLRLPTFFRSLILILPFLSIPAAGTGAGDEILVEGDPLEPVPGRALAVLVNAGSQSLDVFLDREPVGVLEKKTFLALRTEPGTRVVWGSVEAQTFALEEGKIAVLTFNGVSWTRLTWKMAGKGMVPAGYRYASSSAEQRKALAARLEAGEYPAAIQALGRFPVQFDHIACGRMIVQIPTALYRGVLTVEEERITYKSGDKEIVIPVDSIRDLAEFAPGANAPHWTLRIEHGPAEDPDKLSCSVGLRDYPGVRRALLMVRARSLARAGKPAPALEAGAADPGAAPGSPVEGAARLAAALEEQEEALLRPPPGEDPKKREERRKQPFDPAVVAKLPAAAAELDSWLAGHPEDREALMLAARLGRFQELTRTLPAGAGLVESAGIVAESRERLARVQELLDRVIRLEPGHAAAYRLKAQTYGLPRLEVVDNRFRYGPGDSARAAEAAREAARLTPGDLEAVLVFVRYLTAADKPLPEMAAAVREVAGEGHPIAQLLSDLAGFPVPEDAVPLGRGTRLFGGLLIAKTEDEDPYAELRGRVYAVPGSLRTVQAFYRQKWPGVEFFDLEDFLPNFPGKIVAQAFVRTGEGLQPTGSKEGILLSEDGGMFMFMNDAKAMGGEEAAAGLLGVPDRLKAPYSLVWVMSRRSFEEPGK